MVHIEHVLPGGGWMGCDHDQVLHTECTPLQQQQRATRITQYSSVVEYGGQMMIRIITSSLTTMVMLPILCYTC